ncbi:mRNA capping enzyme, catalytic domain-containing protein, partial [Sphaeroforma arctica JP610]
EGNAIGFLEPLDRRLKMAEKQIIRPRKACAKKFEEQMKEEPFHLRIKKFFPIQKAKYIVTEVMPKLTHENDGLILTPVRMRYVSGRFLKLMKWKPPELNSVDFLLKFEITGNAGERKVPRAVRKGLCRVFSTEMCLDFAWCSMWLW